MKDSEILDKLEERLRDDRDCLARLKVSGDLSNFIQELLDDICRRREGNCDTPKPCPFCGKIPKVRYDGIMYEVACDNDDCKIAPSSYRYSTKEEAFDAWNKRG